MYPILGSGSDEILLTSSSSTVALNRHSPSTDKIVEFGKLDDEGIVIVLEEGFGFEARSKDRLQVPACLFLFCISTSLRRPLVIVLRFSHHVS